MSAKNRALKKIRREMRADGMHHGDTIHEQHGCRVEVGAYCGRARYINAKEQLAAAKADSKE